MIRNASRRCEPICITKVPMCGHGTAVVSVSVSTGNTVSTTREDLLEIRKDSAFDEQLITLPLTPVVEIYRLSEGVRACASPPLAADS